MSLGESLDSRQTSGERMLLISTILSNIFLFESTFIYFIFLINLTQIISHQQHFLTTLPCIATFK
jgi:hypothetical protein